MSALKEAIEFLSELLSKGPILSTTVMEKAEAKGIALRTLKRAKSAMYIEAFRRENPGPWYWRIPSFMTENMLRQKTVTLAPLVNPRSRREAMERLPNFYLLPADPTQ